MVYSPTFHFALVTNPLLSFTAKAVFDDLIVSIQIYSTFLYFGNFILQSHRKLDL